MTDRRSAYDEQLPWLEAVDDEDGPRAVSAGRMLAALMVVLLAAAIVAGTFFWLGRQDTAGAGGPELIRAEPGPYKIKPAEPGGLDVAGESGTAFETSAGADSDARLDLSAVPEEAIARPPAVVGKRLSSDETRIPVEGEVPPAPEPQPTGGSGSVIQLGAYANAAQAERAWTALSARFPAVAAMNKLVVPYPGGIRLRAGAGSPAEARQACQGLKVAGENCFVAN